jgi:uncharacterized protein YbjQ (UPF0145 family)
MARTYSTKLDRPATLAELRAFVANTQDMPADAVITVRIGFGGGGRNGSRPTELTVSDQEGKTTR